jgi:ribosomal protein S28E/S33
MALLLSGTGGLRLRILVRIEVQSGNDSKHIFSRNIQGCRAYGEPHCMVDIVDIFGTKESERHS